MDSFEESGTDLGGRKSEDRSAENDEEFEDFLKCPICFDYLNVCMITSCSHNFCSLCIRKYLSYKSQCPMCFEETSEPELRNNRLVDNMVKYYTRKRNPFSRPDTQNHNPTVDSDVLQNHQPTQDSGEKAPCPVCNVLIKVNSINVHLDMCLNRDERMDSLRRVSSVSKRKKLAKVIYHFLSDKDLKKIVGDAGLNDEGERQTLIKRHKSYLVLYNSECDSLRPKPVSEILKQVCDEEVTENDLSIEGQRGLSLDKKMDLHVIEKKQKEYLKKHETQFCKLVEDIQQRQPKVTAANKRNKRKPVLNLKKCDIDTPGTSKTETNNIEVEDDSNLEKNPGPQEGEDKICEDEVPLTDNSSPNAVEHDNNLEKSPGPQEGEDKTLEDEVFLTNNSLSNSADDHSGSESETESLPKATMSTKNKLSRKKASVTEDSPSPSKRSRIPSDEF